MGTVVSSAIINKVQIILQDTTGIQWPATELLGWLNDGQREIAILKPNAFVVSRSVKLAEGTKQQLPEDGVQLIDIPRNMGGDGNTPGRAVRITMRETLDAQVPNWHNARANAECRHYTYNPLDPKRFYCYPPQPAIDQGYVEIVFGGVPPDMATIQAPIALDNVYQNPLIDYILYRAYSKQTDSADGGKAMAHRGAFDASISGKAQGEAIINPNTAAPASPNA